LDAGYNPKSICEIQDIGSTVLTEWRAGMGLSFFGLKDYSQRQGYLSLEQERATQAHFTEHSARNADEVCAYILAEHGQSYSSAGAAKLMRRLGFVYKKPQSLPAQADEAKQAAFISKYETLMMWLGADEMIVFLGV
jgi:transposase